MSFLKQNTAAAIMVGPFVDSTDGYTLKTSLTIPSGAIRLSKNGGAFAIANAGVSFTHNESGWYSGTLNTTDTNTCGRLLLSIYVSGALPVWREFVVLPSMIYDSLIGGTASLSVYPTGISPSALSQIVASGNAANWSGVTSVDGLATSAELIAAKNDIVATGMAYWQTASGFATYSQANNIQVTVNTISGYTDTLESSVANLPTISTIIASGNAAGWSVTNANVTVSGLTPNALSQIVASGNAANWSGVTSVAGLATTSDVIAARDSVISSGMLYWQTATGFATSSQANTIITTVNTISGYTDSLEQSVANLPTINIIIASGNAAGWNNSMTGVTVSGLAPAALSQIVASGNAANWSGLTDLTTINTKLDTISGYTDSLETIISNVPNQTISGIFAEIIDGTVDFKTATAEIWSFSANSVDLNTTASGIMHNYKHQNGSTMFSLFATPSGRIRS